MIAIVRKNITFHLTPKCQKSFKLLKECFTTALVLAHFDFKKEYILKTNSLDNVSIRVFFQYSDNGLFHFVAFFSYKYLP